MTPTACNRPSWSTWTLDPEPLPWAGRLAAIALGLCITGSLLALWWRHV